MARRDSAVPDPVPPPAALDETDVRILACLVEDARLSQRALAREIGMSQPAISERIARALRILAGVFLRPRCSQPGGVE